MNRYIYEYMLKRQIQKTGGSSFSLILPKDWIVRNKLKNKDEIFVFELSNNDLLVRNSKYQHNNSVTVDVDKFSNLEHLYREILGYYVTGYDEIILKSKTQFEPEVRNIRNRINDLMFGFETFYENSDKIILKNVSINSLTSREYLLKMIGNISYMYRDLEKAVEDCDEALAQDIVNRDLEIDRAYYLIMRKFRQEIETLGTEGGDNLPLAVCLYDERRALKLERMADHIVAMAYIVVNHCDDVKLAVKNLRLILEQGKKYIELCEKVITTDDKKVAHYILDNHNADRDPLNDIKISDNPTDMVGLAFQYSIDRIINYTKNMAEETISFSQLPK